MLAGYPEERCGEGAQNIRQPREDWIFIVFLNPVYYLKY